MPTIPGGDMFRISRGFLPLLVVVLALAIPAAGVAGTTPPGGLVVTSHHLASEVGAGILRGGGNAADAAVATAFALAVVLPSAGNLGGGGFLVHHDARGQVTSFDFREQAPLAATERMYLDTAGAVDNRSNHEGPLAVGVPGTVAGLWLTHQRLGRLPWPDLVQPAIDLATGGFAVNAAMQDWLEEISASDDPLYAATRQAFLKDGRALYAPGEVFTQPDLARTLTRIRDEGCDGFYRGETARLIAGFMAEVGGLITAEDLLRYEAVERAPVHGTYRGYDIYAMGPPSSGGVALIEMLNILEGDDLAELGHNSTAYLHLLTEAMRRAFADRACYLGDPDFNDLPVARLLAKTHGADLRATIDMSRASVSDSSRFAAAHLAPESEETTHLSIMDADGNAVSLTYTLEQSYGSGITVPGGGFLLNNEMGDFNVIPGRTDSRGYIGTPANLVAPGKRMLSSMTPTIVARDGAVVLVVGTPGGRTIINSVLQVVLNVVDHGMDIRQAVDAPRFHHQWLPDVTWFEGTGFPPVVRREYAEMGHEVRRRRSQGRVMGILVDPERGVLTGAADSRSFDGGMAGD